jgi:hypothetical protein
MCEIVPGVVCRFRSYALLMASVNHVNLLLGTSASHGYMGRSEKSYEVKKSHFFSLTGWISIHRDATRPRWLKSVPKHSGVAVENDMNVC